MKKHSAIDSLRTRHHIPSHYVESETYFANILSALRFSHIYPCCDVFCRVEERASKRKIENIILGRSALIQSPFTRIVCNHLFHFLWLIYFHSTVGIFNENNLEHLTMSAKRWHKDRYFSVVTMLM